MKDKTPKRIPIIGLPGSGKSTFACLFCIWRLCKRFFTFDQNAADSCCLKGINRELLKYVWNFDREKKENVAELRNRYPHVNFVIFRSNHDATKFLSTIKYLKLNKHYEQYDKN